MEEYPLFMEEVQLLQVRTDVVRAIAEGFGPEQRRLQFPELKALQGKMLKCKSE